MGDTKVNLYANEGALAKRITSRIGMVYIFDEGKRFRLAMFNWCNPHFLKKKNNNNKTSFFSLLVVILIITSLEITFLGQFRDDKVRAKDTRKKI